MNRHSVLHGNDPTKNTGSITRGQRVFCFNRGHRPGCGRTFSLFLAETLPRHTVNATLLWQLLGRLRANVSIKSAAQEFCRFLALETCYHLLARLRRRLDAVRCRLFARQPPPPSPSADPLLQTLAHLQTVFADALCPLSAFQLDFQEPLLP